MRTLSYEQKQNKKCGKTDCEQKMEKKQKTEKIDKILKRKPLKVKKLLKPVRQFLF